MRVDTFEWPDAQRQMRSVIANELEASGIDVTEEYLNRIVDTPAIRDVYIVSIYNAERAQGVKAEYLYYRLGGLFDMTSGSIRNIIQRYTQALCQTAK